MKLPTFIVIGAPKSGTTSLFYYLKQHPDVFLPERKELHFFSYEYLKEHAKGPGDAGILAALCSDRETYESYYRSADASAAVGEFSPSYLFFSDTAEKIFDALGKVRIIAILRNPVEKAYSQYMHLVRDNLENLSFLEALHAEEERKKNGWSDIWWYAKSSRYSDKIKKFFNVFGKDSAKVILFEEFTNDPSKILRDICDFIGVNGDFPFDTSKVYNKTGQPRSKLIANFFSRPNLVKAVAKKIIPERIRFPLRIALHALNTGDKDPIDPSSKKYLKDLFRNDSLKLEKLIGRKTGWL
jgi:hypothetical protein